MEADHEVLLSQLAPSDLDGILPRTSNPNPRGGPHDVQTYNVCDVEALVARQRGNETPTKAKSTSSPSVVASGSPKLAKPNGARILRSKAMKQFNVRPSPLYAALQSRKRRGPSVLAGPQVLADYLASQALAKSIGSAAASPSKGKTSYDTYDYENNYNIFDGLSSDDARALCESPLPPSPSFRSRPEIRVSSCEKDGDLYRYVWGGGGLVAGGSRASLEM